MGSMKSHEWARIAAWIETEGSIIACRTHGGSNRYKARIQISQKHKEPLAWLQERIGGSFRQDEKGTWRLVLSSGRAYDALKGAMPYFISPNKRAQARLALRLSRGLADEKTREIHDELQAIKRLRG